MWGKDEIVYNVIVRVPPDPPMLSVVNSFTDSLQLEWMDNRNGGSSILGYVINYKRDNGDWEELQIDSKTNSHLLTNLWCGTRYQLYITAYNKIGTGLPCDIVNSFTKGNVPVQPKHSQMITNNSTSVTCWLDSWGDGGCGILYFVIECKPYGRSQWNMIANHIAPTERIFTVGDLLPGTRYQVGVSTFLPKFISPPFVHPKTYKLSLIYMPQTCFEPHSLFSFMCTLKCFLNNNVIIYLLSSSKLLPTTMLVLLHRFTISQL